MTTDTGLHPPSRHLVTLGSIRARDEDLERMDVDLSVPADLFAFRGHFEGDPVLPAVVQLDGGVLPQVERAWPDLGCLERARRLKFVRPIRPGDVIRLSLERRNGARQVEFSIETGGETCSSGLLIFQPRDDR